MKYLLLLLIFASQLSFAQCEASNDQCAPVNEWEFSLAVGAGILTNPLHGSSNIPLVLIPKISFYGENIFFENNALGYSFHETDKFTVSAVGLINRENTFFSRWHPSNVFVPLESSSISTPSDSETITQDNTISKIELDDVAQRKWAVDAGMQVNWYVSAQSTLVMRLLHDINSTYNGFNGKVEYNHRFSAFDLPQTQWKITTGLNWLSQQQVDYYYGIGKKDTKNKSNYYQGKSAINPYIKLNTVYKINNNWRLTFTARAEHLPKAISNSPLVKNNLIKTIFLGVVYVY
ncbi:MipA/OmpV family protein [Colwellia sp. KU-HH00111]|uniref:MipA/OmpV family protein n=1 Tax=Colwellia sp. KU-HH00111 TaxID=3127652 RepID=UPI00336576F3